MNIYAIYDNKAKTFNTPFFQATDVNAIRAFKTEVNRQDSTNMLYLYPTDYELHRVGEFNDISGELNNNQESSLLATGEAVKNPA